MKNKISSLALIVCVGVFLLIQLGFQKPIPISIEKNEIQELDTLLNNNNYLVLGFKPLNVKIVHKSEVSKYPDYTTYDTNKDDVLLIKGEIGKYLVFYERFTPKSYKDYGVEVYEGTLKNPIIEDELWRNTYKESIEEQCKAGINFASHYTIVSVGCGTSCQLNLIIDRKTGKIVEDFVTSMGAEYQKGSTLLLQGVGIIDKKNNLMEIAEGFGGAEYVNWNGKELVEIKE